MFSNWITDINIWKIKLLQCAVNTVTECADPLTESVYSVSPCVLRTALITDWYAVQNTYKDEALS